MRVKLLVEISITMLQARLRQTIVAATGVMFGITMFITLLSFMSGLNKLVDGLVTNRTPHVRLFKEIEANKNQPINLSPSYQHSYNFIHSVLASNNRQEIYNAAKIMESIGQDSRVVGFSRRVATQVFFNAGTIDISGIMNGVDVESEIKLFKFKDYVTSGEPMDLKILANSIILGKPLADKLLANLGDVIQISTAQGERLQLKVVGFYQSGLADFDKTQSFVTIGTVQKILGRSSNYITDIQIKLKDIALAPQVAKEYGEIYQTNAEDIQAANAQFQTGTSIRNIISYAVGITLLIVAGFGIYNILNMMIYEKMETIAILKATGFSGRDVKRVFIFIALSIGLFGGITGLIMGFGLSELIDQLPFTAPSLPTVKTYPINYNPAYYAIGIIFSLITTWMAGWFPARKASKIDPVIIIRGK